MLAGIGANTAVAQEGWSGLEDSLLTDRPDFTESTSTVPPGHFQIEGGTTLTRVEDVDATSFGELLVRIGTGEFRLGSYLEWYGFSEETEDEPSTHYVNGGVTFLINNDLQVDARVGTGLNDADPDWFVGVGAGVRF